MKAPIFLPDQLEPIALGKPRGRQGGNRSTEIRESQIEHRLVKRVKELGGEVRKVKWIGRTGAPDRLVMLPGDFELPWGIHPQTIWVELKAPGRKASLHQAREHERMRKMGQRVEVVDSYERIEEILK